MIHKYKLYGQNILLDVESGAVHLCDDVVYELLDFLDEKTVSGGVPKDAVSLLASKYTEEQIEEAYDDVLQLVQRGELFSKSEYEKLSSYTAPSPVKALCLHIAHDCNLRCEYCFASTGDFGKGRSLMSLDIGKRAIDFLLAHSGSRRNLELDFFGGEPLMNFEVVKQIVAYARQKEKEHNKNFRFTITTNGMLLDDAKIDFINQEMSNVVLSLDGRKEINDRIRKRVDGSGCYDKIVPLFKKLVDARGEKDYYVRGTFTKYNLDFTNDVLAMYEAGFEQISVEPVVCDENQPYALTKAELPDIFAEYERLGEEILRHRAEGKWFNFFHFMIDLKQGPCAIKRLRGCGCGNEYVAVTPEGDLYPCHQFVGNEAFKMGSLLDGSFDLQQKCEFAAATIYHKEDCQNCFAKFYCSGGCNANNQIYCGSLLKPHPLSCEMERKRVEVAIALNSKLMEEE